MLVTFKVWINLYERELLIPTMRATTDGPYTLYNHRTYHRTDSHMINITRSLQTMQYSVRWPVRFPV